MNTTAPALGHQVTLVTADGEARGARTWLDGSYSCPFCDAAVISAAGWAEMQRLNAECYAKTGEPYTAESYPRNMRLVWEMRGCPNPACLTLLNPVQLATRRRYLAERDAEAARRTRNHELAMERIAETRASESALWADLAAQAAMSGKCPRCLHASGWRYGRPRLVSHRDPSNCPQARKYAA